MTFMDERTQLTYTAYQIQRQQRIEKAREMAKEAAWRDLPTNERDRYFEWAYEAVKAEERTN